MKQWIRSSVTLGLSLLSYSVVAQELPPDQGVRENIDYSKSVAKRPVEAYGATSIRLGAWQLFPGIELAETYDSNIYATEDAEESDFITILKPRAKLQSDWSVHQINLEVGGDFGFYKQFTDENYQDYYASNTNKFEVRRGTNLLTELLYRHAHEPRDSADNIGAAAEPVVYDLLRGGLGVEHRVGVLGLRVDGLVDDIKYENSPRFGGGTIDNSTRDRVVLDGGLRLSYQRVPGNEAYFSARLKDVNYDDPTKYGGPDRDNWGYNLTLGVKKNVSDLWVVGGYLGYAPSFYADDSLTDVTGGKAFVIGGDLLWNPTSLTSVIGNLDRRSEETTESGASALINTSVSLRVEHKLMRTLLLDTRLGFIDGEYDGSSRKDKTYAAGLGLSYFFTRLVSLRAAYDFSERDSSEAGSSYVKHLASLQLRLNY
ncbi:outer membrane beta-barrel protein [Thiobaca trueperi]|uniref:Uncharacterized protein (PEP-CTERM system associated) n=1 Tax=Thiobaca trueperi TaxID=127458 RepID=A0A4R3MQV8_9GAMM|nr:outer membrane beta-barrel protein [Thiobaca trueperi]TCT18690.1 uncharacterized protein (PEP-CTERM system associated) [Thiobaca trueperi]